MGNLGETSEIKVERDESRGVVYFRVPDRAPTEEIIRTLSSTIAGTSEDRAARVIIDFTAITMAASGGFDEMRKVSGYVDRIQHMRSGARWALVAPADVAFGLARMFEILTADMQVEVMAFRSEEEALAWLGTR